MNCEEMKTSRFPNPLPLCIALLPTSAQSSYFCLFCISSETDLHGFVSNSRRWVTARALGS